MFLLELFISYLTLDNCGTSNYIKKLHHICQTNIDEAQYNSNFKRLFGLRFSCSECIVELQRKGLFPSSEDDSECVSDEEKEDVINDDSSDININERGDETEESDKNDESSINASSDDIDNDNEVMKSKLSVIYEVFYFWKSFKESMKTEYEIPIQTFVNMTSSWKGIQYINHANNIKKKHWSYLKINFYNSVNRKTTQ